MNNLKINETRLWQSLMALAKIGATERGGVCRLALGEEDRAARDLFVSWCQAAGCEIRVDTVGNIFARRPGRRADLPPVVSGSHLDTQPTGGKFDGAYGVMAALEVLRTLDDHGYETAAPLEIVAWTNEEGSRFAPAMMASGVFSGVFSIDEVLEKRDAEGKRFGEELQRIGYAGEHVPGEPRPGAYFEAHIEQGPVLESEGAVIGVVTGAQGQRWYEVTVRGFESHAGTTPMQRRRDALQGAARMVLGIAELAERLGPEARTTVGALEVRPGSRNTIPGEVWFTVDVRNPDEARLTEMDRGLRALCEDAAAEGGLDLDIEQIWHFPAAPFDEDLVGLVRSAAEAAAIPHRDIVSGAGHDACYVARIAPAAMVFVPCAGGVSHNEGESASPSDLAAGCNVLLDAMVAAAGSGEKR